MKLYSTKSPNKLVDLETAIFNSLPPDNGLYMPEIIPVLSDSFLNNLGNKSFREIAFEVANALIGDDIPSADLKHIVDESINFEAPIKEIEKDIYVLELFHGPSMAFKDFGARFMSRVMRYFLDKKNREINILVATSGDTGGAVALGFYDVPGIKVTILYPKGKVSPLQEKQLTTLGKNIKTLEIDGAFDDCQRLVRKAFLDQDLSKNQNLSSANSINIARVIPQTFYYFNAIAQLQKKGNTKPVTFSVPSGNFGNLTAGLLANRMGLPINQFVASTNVNDSVPQYLKTGEFKSHSSHHTLSNAMDIGDPSNFERMKHLFDNDVDKMKQKISGYSFSDSETQETIQKVLKNSDYVMCPHTAIAYAGLQAYLESSQDNSTGVFISSAHPCKFPNVYSKKDWQKVEIPEQAAQLEDREKIVETLPNDFDSFKKWLLEN